VAVVAGCVVAVVVGLLIDTRVAVLAGGLIGPFVGLALPGVILGEQPDNPMPMGRSAAGRALAERTRAAGGGSNEIGS